MMENLRQEEGAMEREMRVLEGKKFAHPWKRKENTPYTNGDITDWEGEDKIHSAEKEGRAEKWRQGNQKHIEEEWK